MKAFTYLGPKLGAKLQDIPEPRIQEPTDIIGKVLATTICGSDLHLIDGFLPGLNKIAESNGNKGLTLGHEGVIEVTEIGSAIKDLKVGDKLIVPAVNSCGECYYCRNNMFFACPNFFLPGLYADGLQAEYIRLEHADRGSLLRAPDNVSLEKLVMLSDMLPTSYEVGVENKISKGDRVVILGCGPVGLCALLNVLPYKPKVVICVDLDDFRLKMAKKLGADYVINGKDPELTSQIFKLTQHNGKKPGADLVIECAGSKNTVTLAQKIASVGGRISIVSAGLKTCELELFELQRKRVTFSTGLLSSHSLPELTKLVADGEIDPSPLITHRFPLSEIEKAYDVFKNSSKNKAIKVLLLNEYSGKAHI